MPGVSLALLRFPFVLSPAKEANRIHSSRAAVSFGLAIVAVA